MFRPGDESKGGGEGVLGGNRSATAYNTRFRLKGEIPVFLKAERIINSFRA
jgi:hypothetical protein